MFWRKQRERNAEVLLKRQVPKTHNSNARSWLGGLPKVPVGTPWPRNTKGIPLHFVTQVACEDLPEALWRGAGPRTGWLLLFVNALDLDRIANRKEVQIIHVEELGPELEPPEDCQSVRLSMAASDLWKRKGEKSGAPKLWRKWPVDLIANEFETNIDPTRRAYPLYRPAEEIYGAPVSDRGILAKDFDLDRPLTWRGVLYVVEGILGRVESPEKFKRDFVGMKSALIDEPPEPDQTGYNKEFKRRQQANPGLNGGDWSAWGAARAALNEEMKAERRSGWLARAPRS